MADEETEIEGQMDLWELEDVADWRIRTGYHRPSTEHVVAFHERARATIQTAGLHLMEIVPPGTEGQNMLDALDEALMWANAGIARRHPDNLVAEGR